MRHLFDSLWYEATVRFVSKVLLKGFSHQQSHFTVEGWRQGQGAILREEASLKTITQQDIWTHHLHCISENYLHVAPVQTLQYDTSQPVLHSRQGMLQQPCSDHTDLLCPGPPQTQRKLFAQVKSHLWHTYTQIFIDIITVTYFPLSVVKYLQLKPKVLTEKQYEPFLQFVWSLLVSPGAQTQRRDGLLLWQPATPSPL